MAGGRADGKDHGIRGLNVLGNRLDEFTEGALAKTQAQGMERGEGGLEVNVKV